MVVSTARALYADTDQMGIVNHAVALRWFEQARAEWLRRLGHSYLAMEAEGMLLPVYELQVRYHKSARYDQVVLLDAKLRQLAEFRGVDLNAAASVAIAEDWRRCFGSPPDRS